MEIIKGCGQDETFFKKNTLLSKIIQKQHLIDGIYRETQTTCLVNALSVGRQLRKFPSDKCFWMGKLLGKKFYQWSNRKPSKREKC